MKRKIWYAIGLTFCLLGVAYPRITIPGFDYYIALPMFLVGILFIMDILTRYHARPITLRGRGLLPLLIVMFLTAHVAGLLQAADQLLAWKEVIKLLTGLISFWTALRTFPRDMRFLARFYALALWGTAFLSIFLLYRYLIVFQAPFLGVSWEFPTRDGLNQYTWYLVFLLPFAITYALNVRPRILTFLPMLIMIFAWVYSGSRGSWVSIVAALPILIATNPRGFWLQAKPYALAFFVVSASSFAAWRLLSNDLSSFSATQRLMNLFDPNVAPELHSVTDRWQYVHDALSAFFESPIFGIGSMNFLLRHDILTHNDYLEILSELGAFGFLPFIGILWIITRRVATGLVSMNWVVLATRWSYFAVLISLMNINAYKLTTFWMFLAITLLLAELEETTPFPKPRPSDALSRAAHATPV